MSYPNLPRKLGFLEVSSEFIQAAKLALDQPTDSNVDNLKNAIKNFDELCYFNWIYFHGDLIRGLTSSEPFISTPEGGMVHDQAAPTLIELTKYRIYSFHGQESLSKESGKGDIQQRSQISFCCGDMLAYHLVEMLKRDERVYAQVKLSNGLFWSNIPDLKNNGRFTITEEFIEGEWKSLTRLTSLEEDNFAYWMYFTKENESRLTKILDGLATIEVVARDFGTPYEVDEIVLNYLNKFYTDRLFEQTNCLLQLCKKHFNVCNYNEVMEVLNFSTEQLSNHSILQDIYNRVVKELEKFY